MQKRPSPPLGGTGHTWRSGCGRSWCRLLACQRMHRILSWELLTQRAVLPIPYPNRLVVAGADDPRELVVEEDGSDVVQVAVECEQASSSLVGPNLDLVVVAPGHEERLPCVSRHPEPKECAARSPVSCESRRRGPAHRAPRTCQSTFPCGSPIVGWSTSEVQQGSMAYGERCQRWVRGWRQSSTV